MGHLTEDQAMLLLEMIDSRNLTSHTYREEVAERIFFKLSEYIKILEKVLERLKTE